MGDEAHEVIEETQEETQEKATEEAPMSRPEREEAEQEEKQGLIDSIKQKLWGDTKSPTELGDTEEDNEASAEAPVEGFVEAAKQAGFSVEQIDQLSKEYDAEQLKELIPHLLAEEELEEETEKNIQESADQQAVPQSDGSKTEPPANLTEELKPFYEELRKEFESRDRERAESLEELKSRLVDFDADKAVQEFSQQAQSADDFFDRASKDFPVFGSTKELNRFPEGSPKAGQVIPVGKEFEARQAVWSMAQKLNTLGGSWDDSLEDAFAWYKGRHGEKELSKKLVRDLKKNETRLSPRRSSKNTQQTYATEYDEKMAIIAEARRKSGIA